MAKIYKNVLIAMDGSKEARDAFRKTLDFFQNFGNAKPHLIITHVLDTPHYPSAISEDAEMMNSLSMEKKESLLSLKKEAQAAGFLDTETLIRHGSPKELLTNEIPTKVAADLIVVGAIGLGKIENALLGSVTEYVVRESKVDVLVIR